MQDTAKVAILVKALPQPSKAYGETVCCAGVTAEGVWKRLFPVRFRHLKGEHSFGRWDWVSFKHGVPKSDRRVESCHVHEESIAITGKLPERERSSLLEPLILGSGAEAARLGHSLALIRPRNTRFVARRKTSSDIEEDRAAYARAARQIGMFDEELAALDPSPFEFRFRFEAASGKHDYQNGDWEAHAMFWHECRRSSEANALRWMDEKFNDEYPSKGMVFAIGNQAKRPQTWQLLGVIRLDEPRQSALAF